MLMLMPAPLLIIEGKEITWKNQPSKKKRPIFLQSGEGEEKKKKKAQLQYTNDFVKKKVLYFSTEKPTLKAHKHDFAKKKEKKRKEK
jgi:hypothetical protein